MALDVPFYPITKSGRRLTTYLPVLFIFRRRHHRRLHTSSDFVDVRSFQYLIREDTLEWEAGCLNILLPMMLIKSSKLSYCLLDPTDHMLLNLWHPREYIPKLVSLLIHMVRKTMRMRKKGDRKMLSREVLQLGS